MRIRIIAGGIFGNDGEYPIGTEFDVDAIPPGWARKVEVIKDDPAPEAVAVTNPAKVKK